MLEGPHARLRDYFGKAAEHEGLAVVATWHPSYALRASDPETREHAYADIVAALAHASELAHGAHSCKKVR